jgi:hypothetical protein
LNITVLGVKKLDKGIDGQRPGMNWWRSLKPTEGCGTKEVLFEQKKIIKSTAFCGSRYYATRLKNSVHKANFFRTFWHMHSISLCRYLKDEKHCIVVLSDQQN